MAIVTRVFQRPGWPLDGAIVELAPSRKEDARALDEAVAANVYRAHQAPKRSRAGRTV